MPVAEPVRPIAAATQTMSPLAVGVAPGGLDRRSWQRLRDGRMAPERTIDLHGRTVAAAHVALMAFIEQASASGVRCVEVITGLGTRGGGAIRRELALWLEEPRMRAMILGAAYPHAANQGAVRLLLRRKRP